MGVRRSLHFVPGANIKMLSKVSDLPADAVVLDLEDSVVLENKGEARKNVISWLLVKEIKKSGLFELTQLR